MAAFNISGDAAYDQASHRRGDRMQASICPRHGYPWHHHLAISRALVTPGQCQARTQAIAAVRALHDVGAMMWHRRPRSMTSSQHSCAQHSTNLFHTLGSLPGLGPCLVPCLLLLKHLCRRAVRLGGCQ